MSSCQIWGHSSIEVQLTHPENVHTLHYFVSILFLKYFNKQTYRYPCSESVLGKLYFIHSCQVRKMIFLLGVCRADSLSVHFAGLKNPLLCAVKCK